MAYQTAPGTTATSCNQLVPIPCLPDERESRFGAAVPAQPPPSTMCRPWEASPPLPAALALLRLKPPVTAQMGSRARQLQPVGAHLQALQPVGGDGAPVADMAAVLENETRRLIGWLPTLAARPKGV